MPYDTEIFFVIGSFAGLFGFGAPHPKETP